MEEPLNSNYSYELTSDKFTDITTINSLKSSLASNLRSSIPKFASKNVKKSIASEEISTEINEEDLNECCGNKFVANFQKNYLELGQWPEIPAQKFQNFKKKYKNMKIRLNECEKERDDAKNLVKQYENGEIDCKSCENLRNKNIKTKLALEQAVQLSNLLLNQVKRMEEGDLSY